MEIIKILIDHNANINAQGNHKNTPLHEATIAQKFDCVEYLLQSGANSSLKNEHGILARDLVKNIKKFTDLFDKYKLDNESNNVLELSQSQFNVSTNVDDLNISCTFSKLAKKSRTNKSVKKVTLYGSGMSNEDRSKFASLASKLNLSVAKEMNNNGFLFIN